MWTDLFELEDDKSVDDLTSASNMANGFQTPNAYYHGNALLEALPITKAQLCAGARNNGACEVNCIDITPAEVGYGITSGTYSPSGLSTNYKKMIACMTGQCTGDAYSSGFFFECKAGNSYCDTRFAPYKWSSSWTTDQGWSVPGAGSSVSDYISAMGPHGCDASCSPHTWGSGLTLRTGTTENLATNSPGAVLGSNFDLWHLRYKL